jgi:hypothetical protein
MIFITMRWSPRLSTKISHFDQSSPQKRECMVLRVKSTFRRMLRFAGMTLLGAQQIAIRQKLNESIPPADEGPGKHYSLILCSTTVLDSERAPT